MSKISLTLIQQVAGIVQPICYKSDAPPGESTLQPASTNPDDILGVYDADWLYQQTVNMVAQMIIQFKRGDKSVITWARKEGLVGEKATILSAVAEIMKMTNAQQELHFKYKVNDKQIQKKITNNDMEIIQEYIRRLPEKLKPRIESGELKEGEAP